MSKALENKLSKILNSNVKIECNRKRATFIVKLFKLIFHFDVSTFHCCDVSTFQCFEVSMFWRSFLCFNVSTFVGMFQPFYVWLFQHFDVSMIRRFNVSTFWHLDVSTFGHFDVSKRHLKSKCRQIFSRDIITSKKTAIFLKGRNEK